MAGARSHAAPPPPTHRRPDVSQGSRSSEAAAEAGARTAHLSSALDELVGLDWSEVLLGPELGQLSLDLIELDSKLGALRLSVAAAFDRSARWRLDGARTPSAWLRTSSGCRDTDAKALFRRARKAREMPATFAALALGKLTIAHLDVLAAANAEGREALFARDEALLVEDAQALSFKHFTKAVRYWIELANEAIDKPAAQRAESRSFHCSETLDGTWRLDGTLDGLDGAEFDNELRRLTDIEFIKDWEIAKARLGRNPTVDELDRTPGQRRADALVEMARRSASTSRPGEPAARLINLRMDYGTFIAEMAHQTGNTDVPFPSERVCETGDGTVIAPSTALDPTYAVLVRRVVFGSANQLKDFGRAARLYRGPLRDAIIERDQECTNRWCETAARYCQVDHHQEWEDDGHTNHLNGRLMCGPDNRAKHADKRRPPPA